MSTRTPVVASNSATAIADCWVLLSAEAQAGFDADKKNARDKIRQTAVCTLAAMLHGSRWARAAEIRRRLSAYRSGTFERDREPPQDPLRRAMWTALRVDNGRVHSQKTYARILDNGLYSFVQKSRASSSGNLMLDDDAAGSEKGDRPDTRFGGIIRDEDRR